MISKNQIKHIQSLHTKKNREEEGLFIVEGIKLVTEFIEQKKFEVKEILLLPITLNHTAKYLLGKKSGIMKLVKKN